MNAPFQQQQKVPDIQLPGQVVEQMIIHLNNAIIFAKSQDGSMRPFVDPMPISQIISTAIQAAIVPGGQDS